MEITHSHRLIWFRLAQKKIQDNTPRKKRKEKTGQSPSGPILQWFIWKEQKGGPNEQKIWNEKVPRVRGALPPIPRRKLSTLLFPFLKTVITHRRQTRPPLLSLYLWLLFFFSFLPLRIYVWNLRVLKTYSLEKLKGIVLIVWIYGTTCQLHHPPTEVLNLHLLFPMINLFPKYVLFEKSQMGFGILLVLCSCSMMEFERLI